MGIPWPHEMGLGWPSRGGMGLGWARGWGWRWRWAYRSPLSDMTQRIFIWTASENRSGRSSWAFATMPV